ncbi:MAG: TolC family protein [Planctomycetaceae bacterium]|nr:TolC family protein [Planctomycetaceae bacterium]
MAVLLGSGCQQPFKISEKKPADRIPISDGSHFTIRQPETGRAVVETDGPVRAVAGTAYPLPRTDLPAGHSTASSDGKSVVKLYGTESAGRATASLPATTVWRQTPDVPLGLKPNRMATLQAARQQPAVRTVAAAASPRQQVRQKEHRPALLNDLAEAMTDLNVAVALHALDISTGNVQVAASSGADGTGNIIDVTSAGPGTGRKSNSPAEEIPRPVRQLTDLPWQDNEIIPVTWQEPVGKDGRFELRIPKEIPGAQAPPLKMPVLDPNVSAEARRQQIRDAYRDLPAIVPSLSEMLAIDPNPMTLEQLQLMAAESSPVLRQAAAEAAQARGKALQAGLYPNPTTGYQSDTVNTGSTAGYHGGFVEQEFVTAGKLSLAQCAAQMEVQAANEKYRQARLRLAADVRRGYYSVLVAQMRVQLSTAVARLTEEAYEAQIALVAGGESVPYEPLQLRVMATRARNRVIRARNGHLASWLQLAANMGLPDLRPSVVAGDPEAVLPRADEAAAWAQVEASHTRLGIVRAEIARAGYDLQLQRVTPIPNVTVNGVVQHDDTSPLNDYTYNLSVGVPLPVFNRNQGNIASAQSGVMRSRHLMEATRNSLSGQLAASLNRYETSRQIAMSYREEILADQMRAYRGLYDRFQVAGDEIDFSQIVVAQQQLSETVRDYVEVLDEQWQAAADLSELLQVERIDEMLLLFGQTPATDMAGVSASLPLPEVAPKEDAAPAAPQGPAVRPAAPVRPAPPVEPAGPAARIQRLAPKSPAVPAAQALPAEEKVPANGGIQLDRRILVDQPPQDDRAPLPPESPLPESLPLPRSR